MSINNTTLLGLAQPVTGQESGVWGDDVNNGLTELVEIAIAGVNNITQDSDITLAVSNGSNSSSFTSTATNSTVAQYYVLNCSGSRTAARNIIVPTTSKTYVITNATTGGYAITIKKSGGTGVGIVSGETAIVFYNTISGDVAKVSSLNTFGAITATSITNSGLTSGRVVYSTTGGLETDSANFTFNGTTATINTLNLTNALGTSYGGTGVTTSTGTGSVVLNTSPTLVTPVLGTPTSGTLTNCTGLPNSGLVNSTITIGGTSVALGGSTSAITNDITIHGLTVGQGAGSVSTNTAVGASALSSNTSGGYSNAFGQNALRSQTTPNGNNAFGNSALYTNTTGGYNSAFGNSTLYSNSTGSNNSAFGSGALNSNTTDNNSAFGYSSLISNTSGTNNVGIGAYALQSNTTASNNTAVGYQSFYNNTTGTSNVGVGYGTGGALGGSTGAINNITAIGYAALAKTTGDSNTAVGRLASYQNTSGTYNVSVGDSALFSNTTASYNVAVGYQAGYSNTTGTRSTFLGSYAGYWSTVNDNTGIGYSALGGNGGGVTGTNNTALGSQAIQAITSGANNTAVGYQAGASITTPGANVCLGSYAGYQGVGYAITTGGRNICIGYQPTLGSSGADTNEIVITTRGDSVAGKGSTTGYIDAGGGGVYQGNNSSSWSTTSDQRLKKNIVDNNVGLDKIVQIQIKNFEYRLPEEVDPSLKPTDAINIKGVQLGVIAQELQTILPDCVKTESTGVLGLDTGNIMWHMINAIKELKADNDSMRAALKTAGVAGF